MRAICETRVVSPTAGVAEDPGCGHPGTASTSTRRARDVEVLGPKGVLHSGKYFLSFSQPFRASRSAGARVGVHTGLRAPPGITPARREVDLWVRSVNEPGGWRGRMCALVCVVELPALPKGQAFELLATMRPSRDVPVHSFTAEAFVALPP